MQKGKEIRGMLSQNLIDSVKEYGIPFLLSESKQIGSDAPEYNPVESEKSFSSKKTKCEEGIITYQAGSVFGNTSGTLPNTRMWKEKEKEEEEEEEKEKEEKEKGTSNIAATKIEATAEESNCGRERLKRHRVEVAGRVWIPEMWGQEDLLKDWIDCTAFDSSMVNSSIMSARSALMEEGRRSNSTRFRIENSC